MGYIEKEKFKFFFVFTPLVKNMDSNWSEFLLFNTKIPLNFAHCSSFREWMIVKKQNMDEFHLSLAMDQLKIAWCYLFLDLRGILKIDHFWYINYFFSPCIIIGFIILKDFHP